MSKENKEKENKEPEKIEVISSQEPVYDKDGQLILPKDILPQNITVLPLLEQPLFPMLTVPMIIDNQETKKMLINVYKKQDKRIAMFFRRPDISKASVSDYRLSDLHEIGVIGEIVHLTEASESRNAPIQVVINIGHRIRAVKETATSPYLTATVEFLPKADYVDNDNSLKAYTVAVIKSIKELIKLNPLHKEDLNVFMSHSSLNEPGRLADIAAALTTASGNELQEILEEVDIKDRLAKVLMLLKNEIDISKIQAKISKQIEEKINKQQRDFFLREQLKLIKNELGISKEGKEADIDLFNKRLKKIKLSKEAKEKYKEELNKFQIIEQHSPEFNVTRNYLDWLTSIPWGVHSKDNMDLTKAEKILDEDHYGLMDVKERILEFLAVGINKGEISATILCLVGPPGVGKTSLGQSIARSLNRKFYRFSLGGARDEAEIKGHRRTYIGAMPGKFIQALKTCKTANPVIMLDEVDKISSSYHGDPASALLEVLDPEQNADFLDHRPLKDRMEIIELAGYIQEEKVQIAKKYLIPKALNGAGLKKAKFNITNAALNSMISGYAREPGVRTLDKQIKKTCRKAAKKFILEKDLKKLSVTKKNIKEFLGEPSFHDDSLYKEAIPGVVMGLAWTSLGGVTLYVEANNIRTDKSSFKQTGQLGKVMIESSLIAYSYIQSIVNNDKILNEFFEKNAIHLHVPAGATPKDGPSAGITMALALYSLATGKPVKKNIAMTGELSLTGRVLPIGGVKEKTIAAKRANVSDIILPKENEKDYLEIPEYIRDGLNAHFVTHFKEIIKITGL